MKKPDSRRENMTVETSLYPITYGYYPNSRRVSEVFFNYRGKSGYLEEWLYEVGVEISKHIQAGYED